MSARARLAHRGPGSSYPRGVEILFWLVPPVVVTAVAMLWVSWLARHAHREVDHETAVRRMGEALSEEGRRRRPTGGYAPRVPQRDRSTGVAVRRSRVGLQTAQPAQAPGQALEQERRAG